mgnify:CR=1 FL=1
MGGSSSCSSGSGSSSSGSGSSSSGGGRGGGPVPSKDRNTGEPIGKDGYIPYYGDVLSRPVTLLVSHWGVYIGNGRVIELLDDEYLHNNNIYHKDWYGFSKVDNKDVVHDTRVGDRAVALYKEYDDGNKKYGYNLYTNNCKDFCKLCVRQRYI